MTVHVEVLDKVTDEAVEAFARLLPQLSSSAPPLDRAALEQVVGADATTILVARSGDKISGTLSLVMFPIPTGVRAWIEDVIVDEAARGQGIGEALTVQALRLAEAAGARTVDLTSRPSREAAGRLYERARLPGPVHPAVPLLVRGRQRRLTPRRRLSRPVPPRQPAAGPRRTGRCSAPGPPGPPRRGPGCRVPRSVPRRSCARATR